MKTRKDYSSLLDAELASFIDPATGLVKQEIAHEIQCPLCQGGKRGVEEVFLKRGYRFVVCRGCGLVFANPQVKPSLIKSLYENADSLHEWVRILQTNSQANFDLGIYKSIVSLADNLIRSDKQPIRCLDISIRGGLFSECDSSASWLLDFFDFSGPTRNLGKSRYPSTDFYSTFDQISDTGKVYDLVISMEAIEHFHDPRWFATRVRSVLADGGVFCGVLSNVESLLVRLLRADAPMFDGVFQKFFFHSSSLQRLLELSGFEDIKFLSTISCSDSITKSLNKLIPDHLVTASSEMIQQIARSAESSLLGYKLMFAARKDAS